MGVLPLLHVYNDLRRHEGASGCSIVVSRMHPLGAWAPCVQLKPSRTCRLPQQTSSMLTGTAVLSDFALPLVTLAALVQPRQAPLDAATLAAAASAASIPSPQKAQQSPGSFFVLPANATGACCHAQRSSAWACCLAPCCLRETITHVVVGTSCLHLPANTLLKGGPETDNPSLLRHLYETTLAEGLSGE